MRRTRPPYSPEFRRRMVDLVHAGRDIADLAREFEPSVESIRAWVSIAARKEGGPVSFADITPWDRFAMEEKAKAEDLSATERDELGRLRRENKQLRVERDILSRAAAGIPSRLRDGARAWFARETGAVPSGSSHS